MSVIPEELRLTEECVRSFCKVTGLGGLVSLPDGTVVAETGYTCRSCTLCACVDASADLCIVARTKGGQESERFGGKYIYNCPMGLTCISTPVYADYDCIAHVTAGPFLMVEEEDFFQYEMAGVIRTQKEKRRVRETLRQVPRVDPAKAEPMAQQLFLAVGAASEAGDISRMLEKQQTSLLMGGLYGEGEAAVPSPRYPIGLEKELTRAIAGSDRVLAEELLNQLLGRIFFCSGTDFSRMRARICELLVLASRAAIDGGADEESILSLCEKYIAEMQSIYDIDKLCFWLTGVLRHFFECLFQQDGMDSRLTMARTLTFIRKNCIDRITLEQAAQVAHLSPSYFSRLFREETGKSFTEYLIDCRVNRAKALLREGELTLTEIAVRTGFCDQSHFSKAFKRTTGVSPGIYRKRGGRGHNELT